MIKANSYYSIACNEFWYLRDAVSPVYCNPAAASAQQIAENMYLSVAAVKRRTSYILSAAGFSSKKDLIVFCDKFKLDFSSHIYD